MIGTDPIERVGRAIARDEYVPHFGVARSVDWATLDDSAPSYACADRYVDQAIETASGSPATFPEGRQRSHRCRTRQATSISRA